MPQAPAREEIIIAGPDGSLEALLETPADATDRRIAILCHPHPQHQGTMLNKVVHMLARAMNDLGIPALRFNFRGVGSSQGVYAGGIGEVQDVGAVAEYVRHRWPDASIWLGGFSFGAVVAVRAAKQINPERLISIAPAVNILGRDLAAGIDSPWLIIQGALDEIVPAAAVAEWVDSLEPRPELVVLPAAGHFFHGQLTVLRETLIERLS
jgi:alpha/beta superfamily hydrolase